MDHLAGWDQLLGHWVGPRCWRWWTPSFTSGLCTHCSLCTLIPSIKAGPRALSAPRRSFMAAWEMSVFPSVPSQRHLSMPFPTITAMLNKVSSRKHVQEPTVSTNPDAFGILFYPSSCFCSHLPSSRLSFEGCGTFLLPLLPGL